VLSSLLVFLFLFLFLLTVCYLVIASDDRLNSPAQSPSPALVRDPSPEDTAMEPPRTPTPPPRVSSPQSGPLLLRLPPLSRRVEESTTSSSIPAMLQGEIRPPPAVVTRRMGDPPLQTTLPQAVLSEMRPPPVPVGTTAEEKTALRDQLKSLGWRGSALTKELTRLLGTFFSLIRLNIFQY
jgi:mRNA-degrading endonuclease toxin of MazEF toxin-antitoxin module